MINQIKSLFKTKKNKTKKPELLSPAGNWIMLRAVIDAGADAIYFGVKELNMRASANNFSLDEMEKVVSYCHSNSTNFLKKSVGSKTVQVQSKDCTISKGNNKTKRVKAYLTLNTIIYDNELFRLENVIKTAKQAKVDAIICWDMAVVKLAKKYNVPIFLSTQSSVSNSDAAEFYARLGVKRIILARECSLKQIKDIIQITKPLGLEVEVFVHGALCVSISGRCFLSHSIFNKSANRGECLQPCRRKYNIKDSDEGYELTLGNDYVLSPKDLCTLPFLKKLIQSGIKAFKIEGRTRSPEYAKVVTECYRKAIDAIYSNQFTKTFIINLMEKIKSVYHRKLSSGFFLGLPTSDDFTDVYGSNATTRKEYVGKVINFFNKQMVASIKLEAKGLKIGDKIMIQGETTGVIEQELTSMEWAHKKINSSPKGKIIAIKMDQKVRENDKVYVITLVEARS